MDAWTFIWLMLILKIPVVALLLLVRWAIKQTPEEIPGEDDGGIAYDPDPHRRHPGHPRPRLPRGPRRGPHRDAPSPLSPPRVRSVVARGRLAQR